MAIEFEFPPGATPIDPDEAEGLIPALATQSELNAFEAQNIIEAVLWAQGSRILKAGLLSDRALRLLHQRMFGNTWRWAGTFRNTQKSIGVEAWRIATNLRALVDDVAVWLDCESYPPDEIAARFHHRLVLIHPFPNGNGRFARLATDLLCEQQGWAISHWGSGDLVKTGDLRRDYIDALKAADQYDIQPLIAFMRR